MPAVLPPDEQTEPVSVESRRARKPKAAPVVDETGDDVELSQTGLVRLRIDGTRYRLRRPFMGELKKLRLALEEVTEEIGDAQITLHQVRAEVLASEPDDDEDPAAVAKWQREKRSLTRQAVNDLTELADKLRLEWWRGVFDEVSLDGIPDELPVWILDPDLPDQVVKHWRSVPLGHG